MGPLDFTTFQGWLVGFLDFRNGWRDLWNFGTVFWGFFISGTDVEASPFPGVEVEPLDSRNGQRNLFISGTGDGAF